MKKVKIFTSFLILIFLLNACARKQYAIKSIDGYLVEMNNSIDSQADPAMYSLVQLYKTKFDTEMNDVIGVAEHNLTKTGKQSLLANFTADAMQESGNGLWETVDFAVINNGGLRTTLNQGPVTVSNLYEIYAFDNCFVLLELPGKAVKQLFDAFAQNKMEGFSKGVRLTLRNNRVESITISGKPLDENLNYRVVTIDYLAEGNDGMDAFTQATQYSDSNITLRDIMIEYIKKLTSENKKIYAKEDDRIEIKE